MKKYIFTVDTALFPIQNNATNNKNTGIAGNRIGLGTPTKFLKDDVVEGEIQPEVKTEMGTYTSLVFSKNGKKFSAVINQNYPNAKVAAPFLIPYLAKASEDTIQPNKNPPIGPKVNSSVRIKQIAIVGTVAAAGAGVGFLVGKKMNWNKGASAVGGAALFLVVGTIITLSMIGKGLQ